MTYDLFKSISDFQEFVGGAVSSSIEMKSIGPYVNPIFQQYLAPWISEAQYQDLVSNLDNLGTERGKLLPYVQRPLAFLTVYEYSKVGNVQFGEHGLMRVEGDNEKTAYKYQENEYRNTLLQTGYDAIEVMLKFLEANEADYPIWQTSTAYNRNKAYFINYASEFREVYSRYISRYTTELLRPILEDVESFAIVPLIGPTQFDALKDGILTKALTAPEQSLIKLIKKAVANFTIEEGLKRHLVLIDGMNIIQNEKLEPQGYERKGTPNAPAFDLTARHQEEWANRHISQIKNFLTNNIDDFPDYKAYIDAQVAAEEDEEETSAQCEERDDCICVDNQVKGIVRF